VLVSIGLKEGDTIADIGCGIGYFTFPASEIVGELGRVFAMDISNDMLEEVDKKIEEYNTSNIVTIYTEENDLKIPEAAVSFAFISNVLHEIEDKEKFLNGIYKIIVNEGRIGIVEWQKIESELGPPLEHRLSEDYIQDLLKGIGFRNIRTQKIGEYFYTLTGEK
jgi:ubiquinone/menaquinone biosynthesis C-methylase UbiE